MTHAKRQSLIGSAGREYNIGRRFKNIVDAGWAWEIPSIDVIREIPVNDSLTGQSYDGRLCDVISTSAERNTIQNNS